MEKDKNSISRRKFIGNVAVATAGATILPNVVWGGLRRPSPNDRLNIAAVGVGGVGATNVKNCSTENIVALCDVDWAYANQTFTQYPNAKKYKDFRKMFDEMGKEIDAVIIATPDHTHAIVAAEAMKMGKHVYLQKPLTHSVYESRYLTELADETGVATQMGNQGNSGEDIQQVCEWIWDDAIGDVTEAHAWTNRPIWPQGLERPTETPSLPPTLAWDLFIGPAPWRPYHPAYTPWNWRAWWDFGTGALGDMGCHIYDPVFNSLDLTAPLSVRSEGEAPNEHSWATDAVVHYRFPGTRFTEGKTVEVTWYDGDQRPPADIIRQAGGELPEQGSVFLGTKGVMVLPHIDKPRLLPEAQYQDYRMPEVEGGDHWLQFVGAVRGEDKTSTGFDYSGPLTEAVLLGSVACRFEKTTLAWDAEALQFTNVREANQFVSRRYRQGWEVDGL